MNLARLSGRLAALRQAGRRRAGDRLAAAAEAIAADLPAGMDTIVTATPAGTAVTVAAPGLAAREFGTAAAPARPVLGPVLDRLRDPEP
ncbi:hypothetical protein [Methylobacterium nodulans]|uniref:Uncharacterized protein n=1 Tax=Methylobacterium nodulans (strain LMG 21967 / CNCM I-2342 / ORS 2060) TaxID=460265 RepID=B8IDG9_METNO|nr:hypothetical protein [Methylobacterium nodulans]ACL61335.1 conserved hypothetical protein [Methylobacterium nodulans ORS 2060]